MKTIKINQKILLNKIREELITNTEQGKLVWLASKLSIDTNSDDLENDIFNELLSRPLPTIVSFAQVILSNPKYFDNKGEIISNTYKIDQDNVNIIIYIPEEKNEIDNNEEENDDEELTDSDIEDIKRKLKYKHWMEEDEDEEIEEEDDN